MRWINHTLIAGACCAVVAPQLVPLAILGSTAPDWIEYIAKLVRRPLKHRGPTHYLAAWLIALLFFGLLADFKGLGMAFAFGGFSHVLCDALTISGVPFSPLSDRRFHLLGGRLRTGAAGEYLVAWGTVLACAFVAVNLHLTSGYLPFFPDWFGRYEAGTASAFEWRTNRFRFF